MISCALKRNGLSIKLVEAGKQQANEAVPPELRQDIILGDFDELINKLVEYTEGDFNFARGVIDEFIRSCPLEVFQGDHILPGSFFTRMDSIRYGVKKITNQTDAIVIADSAYAFNRALRSEAHKASKPIFVLNPHGQWGRLTQGEDENTSTQRFVEITEQLRASTYPYLEEAERYLAERFSGRSLKDLDSASAFEVKSFGYGEALTSKKKVLFLHSFRDASGNHFPEDSNELFFPTYFQWANAAIELIANDQDEWFIKPHPSQAFYANDFDILNTLLVHYGIKSELIKPDLSTRQILESRWPIYTCSGTIAKEAACYGYMAHTVSRQIPDAITQRALSKEDFHEAYLQPVSSAAKPIDDPILIKASRMLVFEQFTGIASKAFEISPQRPVLPSLDAKNFYKQRYLVNLSMARRLCRKSAVFAAENISTEISQAIKS